MKKFVVLIAIIAILLAACGTPKPVQINFWSWVPHIDEQVAEFAHAERRVLRDAGLRHRDVALLEDPQRQHLVRPVHDRHNAWRC